MTATPTRPQWTRSPGAHPGSYLLGAGSMVLSSVSFALMAASAKAAAEHVSSVLIVLIRSFVIVVVCIAIMRSRGIPLRSRSPRLMALRCICGVAALQLYYYALTLAPLAEVVLLANTPPLYVPLLGMLFLGERPRPLLVALIGLGFLGVVAVIWPATGIASAGGTAARWGLLAAGGTGFFSAVAIICIRRLTSHDHPLTIVLGFAFWSFVVSLPSLVGADPGAVRAAAVPIALTTVAAIAGQVFITYALRFAAAASVIIFNYTGVLVSFVIGLLVWGEEPTFRTLLGATLIVAVCVSTTRLGARLTTVNPAAS